MKSPFLLSVLLTSLSSPAFAGQSFKLNCKDLVTNSVDPLNGSIAMDGVFQTGMDIGLPFHSLHMKSQVVSAPGAAAIVATLTKGELAQGQEEFLRAGTTGRISVAGAEEGKNWLKPS